MPLTKVKTITFLKYVLERRYFLNKIIKHRGLGLYFEKYYGVGILFEKHNSKTLRGLQNTFGDYFLF